MENAKIEGVQDIVKVKYADARDIPFPGDYFDAVSSVFVIHNIRPNRGKAIFEMIRVLKAGGILTIAEAGGIVWWLKYDMLPKLLKEERLEDIQIKRCLFNQVVVVKKGHSARC
jgi:ubiquinone/menaquinone biosynthesis C-methylase UbiE